MKNIKEYIHIKNAKQMGKKAKAVKKSLDTKLGIWLNLSNRIEPIHCRL